MRVRPHSLVERWRCAISERIERLCATYVTSSVWRVPIVGASMAFVQQRTC